MIGSRYRMIGLIGRGGMGEVYRADDLKLGQPVALKFLPSDVERDPDRLERFLSEVRLSLRVTHPNVCRVFDIGQFGDRTFLSMEYVDGEDLASLLRRIGRLPEDKAIEISRQLCAGLAAAHDEGVLHRDLKPANIMIDGRGRAKIADFGLAGATEGIAGYEARVGTPQYMAPEQVAGGALSERTDVYALGLVLYELFTGKRAFDIKSADDLQRLSTSTPTSPSSYVSGLSPLVERAILRCLEPDPARRPASAAALAAALPGGDPLAMAIAAGDTPSPEMVAAAGSDACLRPAVAWPVLGVALVAALATALLNHDVVVANIAAPAKPPDVLIERAREIVRSVGVGGPEGTGGVAQDDAWGLETDFDYLSHVEARRPVAPADDLAARGVLFWYRESPMLLERGAFSSADNAIRVSFNDPPLSYSGEVRVWLDRDGRLVNFAAVPSQRNNRAATAADADWPALFRAAGLDSRAWVPALPLWTPQFFADRQVAWVLRDGSTASAVRVEAGSFEGRPVSFQVIFPWTTPHRITAMTRTPAVRIADLTLVLLLASSILGSGVVARRNLRLDRADRRGAVRLAVFAAALSLVGWFFDEHHVASVWESVLFLLAMGAALATAALMASFYLALEPYVRRTWPAMIVSWSRIVAGTIRDPLVARDVLIGCAAGAVQGLLRVCLSLVEHAVTGVPVRFLSTDRPFLGAPHILAELSVRLGISIFVAFGFLFILFVLRLILRRDWAAILAASLLWAVPFGISGAGYGQSMPPVFAVFFVVAGTVTLFVTLARVGLVATITMFFVSFELWNFPFVWPPTPWYSGAGFVGVAVTVAIAIAAFYVATGAGQRAGLPARATRAA
jgi:serine/threonine-protein kinase